MKIYSGKQRRKLHREEGGVRRGARRRCRMVLAGVLCLALVFTYVSVPEHALKADAAETEGTYTYEGCTFSYTVSDDGTYVTITGCADDDANTTLTSLVLPETIDGLPVAEIGNYAFQDYTALETAVLPDQLTTIGKYAFAGCTYLESIELPDSLTTFHDTGHIFDSCESLVTIEIPDAVTTIPQYTFYQCSSLSSITFSENLKTIQSYAFQYCVSLTSLEFPDSLTAIRSYAFNNCSSISYVLLPNSDLVIYTNNFEQSTDVDTIEYAEGCTRPYTSDTWTTNGAFVGVAKKVILPSTVTDLSSGITDYTGSVTSNLMSDFHSLEEVEIAAGNETYASYDGAVYDADLTTLYMVPVCKSSIEFAQSCTTIASGAFSSCSLITEITIPSSVSTIESGAFSSLDGIESLAFPSTVTSIGSGAITGCSNLTDVTYYYDGIFCQYTGTNTNYVKEISELAISDGTSSASEITPDLLQVWGTYSGSNSADGGSTIASVLESVSLPASAESIAEDFFDDMTALEEIAADEDNEVYFSENGILYQYASGASEGSTDGCVLVRYPLALGYESFADGMAVIGARAFYGCLYVKMIDFPDTLERVEEQAFYECEKLTITFEEGLTSIGDEAFYNCLNSEITVPASVEEIGTNAFYTSDYSLKIFCYRNTAADEYALYHYITYEYLEDSGDSSDTSGDGSSGSDTSDSDPSDSSDSDGSGSDSSDGDDGSGSDSSGGDDDSGSSGSQKQDSSNSSSKKGASVGTKVTKNGAVYKVISSSAVQYVSPSKKTVKKAVIPASVKINGKTYKVTSIKASAFANCKKLTSVTLGKNIKKIGKKAFYNCKKLKKVTIKSSGITSFGKKSFKGIAKKAVIRVPKAKKAAYKKKLKKAGIAKTVKVK